MTRPAWRRNESIDRFDLCNTRGAIWQDNYEPDSFYRAALDNSEPTGVMHARVNSVDDLKKPPSKWEWLPGGSKTPVAGRAYRKFWGWYDDPKPIDPEKRRRAAIAVGRFV